MSDTLQDHVHSPDPYATEEDEARALERARLQFKKKLAMAALDEQLAMLAPEGDEARRPPVQGKDLDSTGAKRVHQAAAEGVQGSGAPLPHYDRIQQSFGAFDVSGVEAYTGERAGKASEAMGAVAYASGTKVAFKGSPDLHTAAHEAAHIVQQGQGVSLDHGVGQVGDAYEQHADAVADRVVRGESAEDLLASGPKGSKTPVRRKAAAEAGVQKRAGGGRTKTTG